MLSTIAQKDFLIASLRCWFMVTDTKKYLLNKENNQEKWEKTENKKNFQKKISFSTTYGKTNTN